MATVTINMSDELFLRLALEAEHEQKSVNQYMTEKVELYYYFKDLMEQNCAKK